MNLFKKKPKKIEEDIEEEKLDINPRGDPGIELAKLTAKVESLLDIRKAYSEKFSLLSEQIGEIRGMILDASKQIQHLEVGSTKAIELVNEVQPEKFMSQLHQMEGKIESLKAHVESKDAIMHDITEELQTMRKQMGFYRGLEQVSKLSDEIKKDLFNIKKVQSTIERHSDQVESIFIELQKKYGELDSYAGTLEDLQKNNKELLRVVDTVKIKMDEKADKKSFTNLSNNFDKFLTQSGLKQVEEYIHQTSRFQKMAEDNTASLLAVKQKLDELKLNFEKAHTDELQKQMKDYEKEQELLKIEIQNARDLIEGVSKQKSKYAEVDDLIQKNNSLKKQVTSMAAIQETLQQEQTKLKEELSKLKTSAAGKKMDSFEKEYKDIIETLQADVQHLASKMGKMQKETTIKELKGIGGGIATLQKALGENAKTAKKFLKTEEKTKKSK